MAGRQGYWAWHGDIHVGLFRASGDVEMNPDASCVCLRAPILPALGWLYTSYPDAFWSGGVEGTHATEGADINEDSYATTGQLTGLSLPLIFLVCEMKNFCFKGKIKSWMLKHLESKKDAENDSLWLDGVGKSFWVNLS